MDELDPLVVRFRVDLEGLTAGLEKAHEAIRGVGEKMTEGFKKVGETLLSLTEPANLLRGFIAGELVHAFGEMVYSSLESVEALGKLADRLGISTEGLAGLEYAAQQAGVPVDALTAAFKTSERVISSADDGNKKAIKTFEDLKIPLEDLRSLNPEEQFSRIADAIAKTANVNERARLAQEAYGRSGSVILPMLLDGEEGLLRKKEEAAALGLAHSREETERAALAIEAIKRIGSTFDAVKETVAIALAPAIAVIAEKIGDSTNASATFKAMFVGASEAIIDGVGNIVNFVHALAIEWDVVKVGFGYFQVGVQYGLGSVADAVLTVAGFIGNLGKIATDIGALIGDAFKTAFLEVKSVGGKAVSDIEADFGKALHAIADEMTSLGIKGAQAFSDAAYAIDRDASKSAGDLSKEVERATKKGEDDVASLKSDISNVFDVSDMRSKNPFNESFEVAKGLLAKWKSDLDKDMEDPKPGDDLKRGLIKALDEVIKKAEDTAAKMKAALKPPGSDMTDSDAKTHLDQLYKDLGDQTRAEDEAYAQRLENLNALHDAQRISDAQYLKDKEKLESQHEGVIYDIHRKARANEADVETKYRQQLVQGSSQMFGNLATLMQSHHREQFEIGKAAAIAQTTINTASAAMGAYNAMADIPYVGPVLGALAAAAAIAAGAVQISNIQSTSFGGGGSTGGSFGGVSAPGTASATAPTTASGADPTAAGATVNIHLPTDQAFLPVSAVRNLIAQINQAGADGTKISKIAVAN